MTTDPEITRKADCIVGVASSKGCADISEKTKKAIQEGSQMFLLMEIPDASEEVRGMGHPALSLRHPREMVFRTSQHICERTVFISADKAAGDLDRIFVNGLRDPEVEIEVTLGPV